MCLDEVLADALDKARTTWPGLTVDEAAFLTWLKTKVSSLEDAERLCTRDLYLAYACLDGDTQALAAFDRDVMPAARHALSRMTLHEAACSDILQTLRIRVLLAHGEAPRLKAYAGRGDLRSWVRVIATRLALDLKRSERRHEDSSDGDFDRVAATRDPELAHLRERYAPIFAEAFSRAAASLTPEDRNVLRYHYVDRLSIDAIGEILQLHRVTAARRITKARDAWVAAAKTLFATSIGARPSQLSSELRVLGSAAEVTFGGALGPTDHS